MKQSRELRIFIVEDNLIYQQLIAKELEPISADVHFFTRGESCVEALELNPAIVVLDFNLAGSMNGLDTLKSIRSFNPSIYALLFSNQEGLNSPENFSAYGSFDFIEKKETTFCRLREKITSSALAFQA
ncbi:MAG: response regulator [Chitinophagaceae bacterium]|nr:response regulator [Chitinophagaceae bacterium]